MALSQKSTSHSSRLPNISTIASPSLPASSLQQSFRPRDPSQTRPSTSLTDTSVSAGQPSTDSPNRSKHRQSTLSTSSSKQSRTGLFTLAALARDKTNNAIATLSDRQSIFVPEPSVRSRQSSGSLYRTAQSSPTSSPTINSHSSSNSKSSQQADSPESSLDPSRTIASSSASTTSNPRIHTASNSNTRQSLLETNPPSQAYSDTAADTPPPISFVPQGKNSNKMHQTSSRLLRMTDDERPFTRVCNNLHSY